MLELRLWVTLMLHPAATCCNAVLCVAAKHCADALCAAVLWVAVLSAVLSAAVLFVAVLFSAVQSGAVLSLPVLRRWRHAVLLASPLAKRVSGAHVWGGVKALERIPLDLYCVYGCCGF